MYVLVCKVYVSTLYFKSLIGSCIVYNVFNAYLTAVFHMQN